MGVVGKAKEDAGVFWGRLLAELPPTRRAIFREGEVLAWGEEEVRVAFRKPFFYERALGFKGEVEQVAGRLFRGEVRLVLLLASEGKTPPSPSPEVPSFRREAFPSPQGRERGPRGRKIAEKRWFEKAALADREGEAALRGLKRVLKPFGGEVVLLRLPREAYVPPEEEETPPPE